jgi:hypothetical protein
MNVMANARTEAILARIGNERLRTAARECLDLGEKFKARRAEIESSGIYTDAGRRKALVDALAREFAPALRRAQQPIAKAMDDARRRRAALAMPAPDPTDVVAALDRHAILARISALAPLERLPFALESKDMRIVEAVLSSPRMLSGFTEQDFDLLRSDTQARLHGPAIAEIAALESEVAEANVAVQLAQGDLRQGSGLDEKDFAEIIGKPGPNEVPWLLREPDGRVLVVRPGEGTYPEATAVDIARGKFFANLEEYQRDRAV